MQYPNKLLGFQIENCSITNNSILSSNPIIRLFMCCAIRFRWSNGGQLDGRVVVM